MTGYETPTVATLLRRDRVPHRSPSGGMLTARRWGRRIVILDIDRYGPPFPEEVAEIMRPLADDLALLAFWARRSTTFISQFGSTGTLHAPAGAAERFLAVLVAADDGDVTAALEVAPAIRELVAPLRVRPLPKARARTIASAIVTAIEVDLADRAGAASIAEDPAGCQARFAAFTSRCSRCGRALTDPASKTYGVGPDCRRDFPPGLLAECARRMGAAHAEALEVGAA